MNRRLGLLGTVIFLAVAIAAIVAVAQFLPSKGDDEPERTAASPTATATAKPSACKPVDPPYGTPPDDFTYAPVEEAKRAQTVTALRLDEAEGKVDVREARQTSSGLSLGSIVGVPSKTPDEYATDLVASVAAGGAEVQRANGYAIVPLKSGSSVAVGVKGCQTVLVNAQDPNAVQFLAAAIFSE